MPNGKNFCSDYGKLLSDVGEMKGTMTEGFKGMDRRIDEQRSDMKSGFGTMFKRIDKLKERASLDEDITAEIQLEEQKKKRGNLNPFANGDGSINIKKIIWFFMGIGAVLYFLMSGWTGFIGFMQGKEPVNKEEVVEAVKKVVDEIKNGEGVNYLEEVEVADEEVEVGEGGD